MRSLPEPVTEDNANETSPIEETEEVHVMDELTIEPTDEKEVM